MGKYQPPIITVLPSTFHFKHHTSKYLVRTKKIFAIYWIILPEEIKLLLTGNGNTVNVFVRLHTLHLLISLHVK